MLRELNCRVLRQTDETGLRSNIGSLRPVIAIGVNRGDVDDRTADTMAHPSRSPLRYQERSGEICANGLIPTFERNLEEFSLVDDACIVDDNVKTVVLAPYFVKYSLDVIRIADTAGVDSCLASTGRDPRRNFLERSTGPAH